MEQQSLLTDTDIFLQGGYDVNHISLLRGVISEHAHRYYVQNQPVIDDTSYDELLRLLMQWEEELQAPIPSDSPSRMVGLALLDGFKKVTHRIPMLSLQNTYNGEEIQRRYESQLKVLEKHDVVGGIDCIIEPKLDGSSVEIVYDQGVLIQASTRGNGNIGEDITEHIKYISGVPHSIPEWESFGPIHLRGEVVMPEQAFIRINDEAVKQGDRVFANARNAAAGTLRQLDPSQVWRRGLQCYVFEILVGTQLLAVENATDQFSLLRSVGLPVHPWLEHASTIEELITLCEDDAVAKQTQNGDVACDGLVIKSNDFGHRKLLGKTEHHPKWAIAYKYPAQEVVAHLTQITRQVGRTGALTPVAVLDPVQVGGVVIQRASLHNLAYIQTRHLFPGVRVWIKRSGEVIPYVIGLVDPKEGGEYVGLSHCPSCRQSVTISDDTMHTVCTNAYCPAQQVSKLIHYVSRDALNIEGLGDRLIEQLYDVGLVTTPADLYQLDSPQNKHTVLSQEGIGEKTWRTLIDQIEYSKKRPLWTILYGLGISGIGKKLAKTLTRVLQEGLDEYGGDDLVCYIHELFVDREKLASIYGIGGELSEALGKRIQNAQSIEILERLVEYGVITREKFQPILQNNGRSKEGSMFADARVCITGTFPVSRKVIEQCIEDGGGRVVSSVSKKTTFVIVGDSPGSKYVKAQGLGVMILNREDIALGVSGDLPRGSKERQQSSLFG